MPCRGVPCPQPTPPPSPHPNRTGAYSPPYIHSRSPPVTGRIRPRHTTPQNTTQHAHQPFQLYFLSLSLLSLCVFLSVSSPEEVPDDLRRPLVHVVPRSGRLDHELSLRLRHEPACCVSAAPSASSFFALRVLLRCSAASAVLPPPPPPPPAYLPKDEVLFIWLSTRKRALFLSPGLRSRQNVRVTFAVFASCTPFVPLFTPLPRYTNPPRVAGPLLLLSFSCSRQKRRVRHAPPRPAPARHLPRENPKPPLRLVPSTLPFPMWAWFIRSFYQLRLLLLLLLCCLGSRSLGRAGQRGEVGTRERGGR